MKILILSDLHLGSPMFSEESTIINLLKSEGYDVIVLNGDIFDVWEEPFDKIKQKNFNIVSVIREISKKKKVYFVDGNHDPDLDSLKRTFPDVIFSKDLQLGDIFFIHGCEFDKFVTKYSLPAKILFVPNWICERTIHVDLKGIFRNISFSIANKRDKKYYGDLVNDINKAAIDTYKSRCKYLIMGHTHFPIIIKTEECTYINSGDMIHNRTYAEFNTETNFFEIKKV